MANNRVAYGMLKNLGIDPTGLKPYEAWKKLNEHGIYYFTPRNKEIEVVDASKKITPAEKMASVKIDFNKDNILPELNNNELKKIGAKTNKTILVKKETIDRNKQKHSDIAEEDFEKIIKESLYKPIDVYRANEEKPYFHFFNIVTLNSKKKPKAGLVLLEVSEKKEHFEVVHVHCIEPKRLFNKIKKD